MKPSCSCDILFSRRFLHQIETAEQLARKRNLVGIPEMSVNGIGNPQHFARGRRPITYPADEVSAISLMDLAERPAAETNVWNKSEMLSDTHSAERKLRSQNT